MGRSWGQGRSVPNPTSIEKSSRGARNAIVITGGVPPPKGGASRQKVVRFKQPYQLRGPFASLRQLSGVFEGEGLRQGLVERCLSAADSFSDRAPRELRGAADMLLIATGPTVQLGIGGRQISTINASIATSIRT